MPGAGHAQRSSMQGYIEKRGAGTSLLGSTDWRRRWYAPEARLERPTLICVSRVRLALKTDRPAASRALEYYESETVNSQANYVWRLCRPDKRNSLAGSLVG